MGLSFGLLAKMLGSRWARVSRSRSHPIGTTVRKNPSRSSSHHGTGLFFHLAPSLFGFFTHVVAVSINLGPVLAPPHSRFSRCSFESSSPHVPHFPSVIRNGLEEENRIGPMVDLEGGRERVSPCPSAEGKPHECHSTSSLCELCMLRATSRFYFRILVLRNKRKFHTWKIHQCDIEARPRIKSRCF